MAGSHEVRGSIPLGSTTDPRGARRRRRAPLFCFRADGIDRPAGHDCSWALQPAGLLSPAFPGTCLTLRAFNGFRFLVGWFFGIRELRCII